MAFSAISDLRSLWSTGSTGQGLLDIVDQAGAGIIGFQAIGSQGAVEQDDFGGEGMDAVVDAGKRVLRGIDHQAEDQRGHDDEDVGDEADNGIGFFFAVARRQPRIGDHGADRGDSQADEH
jgi:hypothetical protein